VARSGPFELFEVSMLFIPKHGRLLCCAVALAAAGACGGDQAEEPPVAAPALTLSRSQVAIGSPLRLTYRFDVAEGAKIDGDYWVFVHVLDNEGEQLWTDDHVPPVPTSQWQGGQKVEYTRTVFVQNYPYIGPAVIRVGLYSQETGRRLPLSGEDQGRREYQVASFELRPQSENIFLIYKDGWHPSEVDPRNPSSEWQWTQKTATIAFANPKKDCTLYLEYDARPDQFPAPQQVTVKSGGQEVGTFTADTAERRLATFPLGAAQLGTADIAELVIEVDRTFKPGGGDPRELGIRVFHAFVEPK
jgi:hypothetical protein